MHKRRALLTDEDRAHWSAYARLVRPLPGRTLPPPPATPESAEERPAPSRPAPPAPIITLRAPRQAPLSIGTQPPGIDNASWNRFRGGKIAIMRTLDLHGQTIHRAFKSFQHFLHRGHADHLRCVEVITGRGSGETGTLRREFPLWLNLPEIRPLILAAAHPHAANPGSVRLLLRRPK